MGGHHDFGPKMKIPDYKIYKVKDIPELVQVETMLAQKGLKDPWLRNEVWRYDRKEWATPHARLTTFATRGMKWGFAAFVATIVVETIIDKMSDKKPGHH